MMQKWKCRGFAAASCLLLALWAAIMWQGAGAVQELEEQEQSLHQMQEEYAALERLQEEHPDVEKYQLEVEMEKKRVAALLPDEMQTGVFLQELKAASDRTGMVLCELVPEEAQEENGLLAMGSICKGIIFPWCVFCGHCKMAADSCRWWQWM